MIKIIFPVTCPLSGKTAMPKREKKATPAMIVRGIGQQIRNVLRRLDDLRFPIQHFYRLPDGPDGRKRYYAFFSQSEQPRDINGLVSHVVKLQMYDERLQADAASLAVAIWHLRDPLVKWTRLVPSGIDVEEHWKKSVPLKICCDVANHTKHVGNDNTSGRNPQVGTVSFDTSKSGAVEVYYNGGTKEKRVVVSDPNPITYRVNLEMDGAIIEDITSVFENAVRSWFYLIDNLGMLAGTEHAVLRNIMKSFSDRPVVSIVESPKPAQRPGE